ncbi:recombinase family protein [Alicyclobacillus cycloheptanicus]|uniref:DNA invertase Pin-like site-specific DNA recombinase n=1 Tax=Alicyclobacillus cycloheptanicus TaxID=1457 RepID=A0ABT9XDB1_9BACL|nr:DNA invertase Pin-like site-specific DNA recombinase [Alicyclobacillus cycloheptanicus]WDM00996.1 recombinase family protein [Alicyclobacillus cycloheptanicus]
MNRAAIYVRVSTDLDSQKYSPEHQLAACREYAEAEGLTTDDTLVYNDAGLSGTEMENRHEVKRMLNDARLGKFEAVLFTAVSRFGRDMADVFSMRKKLESVYGIRIASIEEGYDSAIEGRNSEQLFTVYTMLAAHKSKEMSLAIKRGLRQAAKRGRHIGNVVPYGYTKNADKQLIPNPTEAAIIQDIFKMYLNGNGSKSIAEQLNMRGVPTATKARKGKDTLWGASTINAILHNEVYIGRLIAHRWQIATDYKVSRQADSIVKRQSVRDQDEWVVIDGAHEAIIDTDTFNRVQDMLNRKAKNKGIKRTSNLLAGLMTCKNCGGSMIVSGRGKLGGTRDTYKYVICAATRRIGKYACPNHQSVKYEHVLNGILEDLRSIAHSERDIDQIATLILTTARSGQEGSQQRLEALKRQLEANQEQQMKNLEAFSTGLFPRELVEQRQTKLRQEAEQLKKEISSVETSEQREQDAARKVQEIRQSLNVFLNLDDYDEMTQRIALRKLIDRIEFDAMGNVEVRYSWLA